MTKFLGNCGPDCNRTEISIYLFKRVIFTFIPIYVWRPEYKLFDTYLWYSQYVPSQDIYIGLRKKVVFM